ncbi:MAG TPA: hypothetical protein PLV65_02210 [Tenuifilaceae bacterium]|nr:hypothetical protein [Tenuifilaceae bacterium]
MATNQISRKITVFQGRTAPEEALLVGYGALIEAQGLAMPLPKTLTLISSKKRVYNTPEWRVLSSSYAPVDTLYGHLVFALKYEGVNLLFFKKLFEQVEKSTIESWIKSEPLGQYSRRIWFLYEWLLQKPLDIPI